MSDLFGGFGALRSALGQVRAPGGAVPAVASQPMVIDNTFAPLEFNEMDEVPRLMPAPVYPDINPGYPGPFLRDPNELNTTLADTRPPPLPQGLVQPGNINLANRVAPLVQFPGGFSTVRSITIGDELGREIVIPTVIPSQDGWKIASPEEAKEHYRRTGEHLGIFNSQQDAEAYAQNLHNELAQEWERFRQGAPGSNQAAMMRGMQGADQQMQQQRYLRTLEQQNGLPPGMLDRVWAAESGRGANAGVSRAGALGPFQFMPATWQQYGGGGDPNNFNDSANAAGRYLSGLMREFGGDQEKALAAYNWGSGNVQRAGPNWRAALPQETKDYLTKTLPTSGV